MINEVQYTWQVQVEVQTQVLAYCKFIVLLDMDSK